MTKKILAALIAVIIAISAISAGALSILPPFTHSTSDEVCNTCGVRKLWRATNYRVSPYSGIDRMAAKRDIHGELLVVSCEQTHRLIPFSISMPEPRCESCDSEIQCEVCDDCLNSACVCVCEPLPPIGFEIAFNLNGGELPSGTPNTLRTDEQGRLTGVLPVPTREGHLFFGWRVTGRGGNLISVNIDATGLARRGSVFAEEDIPGDWNIITDFTLYAEWTAVEDTTSYAITLDANGGNFYENAPTVIPTAWNQRIANQTIPT
ncbi:MAG: InlB B-repeat-containing protein, partial [Oscillospiraceae bacterium]|nr:InlB B-repeat-containing protein [Oscillospiraceae bacterium]